MSKFVTYPAVTVLDNDHSLLIDDPNAGTNSITAENAGNTLLSKWAGFETFEEAVQNTISNNQEFIDRDTAIRSETAELKKKIVTTFPAKDASGAVATFESEFEDAPLKSCIVQVNPVQDLHGYDSPWPAGGGKNLFRTTAETTTVDGVTFTVNSDGSIKTTGTPTRAISTFVFGKQTLPSGEYIANGFANGANSETRMVFFNENTGAVVAIIYKGNGVTFTLTEESVIRVYPIILTDSYESGWTFYPMIRKVTEADATFAPYSNECPITGWTGCEVQRTWKNLWDEEWEIGSYASSTGGVWNTTGRIRSKADNYISIVPNTLYYSKCSSIIDICYYDADKTHLSSTAVPANSTFTTPSNARYMRFGLRPVYGTTYNHDISINYPSTDHDYHPYVGQTYPITFPTEAGTVYGGYIDPISGDIVADMAIVDLGTKNWGKRSLTDRSVFYCYLVTENARTYSSITENMTEICSHYPFGAKHNGPSNLAAAVPNKSWGRTFDMSTFFVIRDDDYDDAASFKEAMNGVQLCYELAEPIHYPLTPIEIKTLLGQNNIWANTGDTSVEYLMSDVSWYVEKKLRAFQSILAGVEDSETSSKNYSANTYLIFNNDIYRVTKAITTGETIEEGVNVTKTTVAEQLMALAQA